MKLLIVDDEPLIHKSIEYCFGELQEQDVVLYHAYNGADMLQQLKNQPVDGVLVDIQMPGFNGLMSIQEAKKRRPEIEYYIMSGFSEFEYAKEAVHLGVTEYLIKPLSPEDLSRVITDIRNKQQKKSAQILESFRTWLVAGLHRHEVSYLYTPGYYVVFALLTYDSANDENAFWVPDFGDFRQHVLSLPCDEGLLLLAVSSAPAPIHTFFKQFPKAGLPHGITVFISAVCSDSAAAFAEMRKLLDAAPLRVIHGMEICYDHALLPQSGEQQKTWAACLVQLRDAYFAKDYQTYVMLHARVRRGLKEIPERHLTHVSNFLSCLFDREVSNSGEEILQALQIGEQDLLRRQPTIDRTDSVMNYIEHHYCEELSIAELAVMFDLTPNYLSSLLKSRKNIKFTDYLTALRLRKAKELLLSTDLSVKEISEQVGYHSQSHFTKLFLKNVNYTPAEFKHKFSGKSVKE